MSATYTFDVERVRLEGEQLIVSALVSTLEDEMENAEVTVPVAQMDEGKYRPDLDGVEALELEDFCEGIGFTDGPELARCISVLLPSLCFRSP